MKLLDFVDFITLYYLAEAEDFCKVRRIGEKLSETFVSIGLQKGSPYRDTLNRGIMTLHKKGIIASIREKWILYSERNCDKVTCNILKSESLYVF